MVFNFSRIHVRHSSSVQSTTISSFLLLKDEATVDTEHSNINKSPLRFPWCLTALHLHAFDMLRLIELFVKSTTSTSSSAAPKSQQLLPLQSHGHVNLLSRDVIRHLSACEERICESLAWQSRSPLWAHLARLKLANSPSSSSSSSGHHVDKAFPLSEDVNGGATSTSSHLPLMLHHPHYQLVSAKTTTTQPTSSSSSFSVSSSLDMIGSPVKQAPTITRVVCSADSPLKAVTTTLTTTTTTTPSSLQQQQPPVAGCKRLKNMSSAVAYFFRKFYQLANARLRLLVDKLDLAQMSVEMTLQQQSKSVSLRCIQILNDASS